MSRKRNGCKYCDTNSDEWTWQTFPFDMGVFGNNELSVSINKYRATLTVEVAEEGNESFYLKRTKISYCPFCGTNFLRGDDNGRPD